MKKFLILFMFVGTAFAGECPEQWVEPDYIYDIIDIAEQDAELPRGLLHCQVFMESKFNPKALSKVVKGYRSCGLTQLYRKYIVAVANQFHDGGYATFRWDDPADSAQTGSRYLASLIKKFGGSVYLGLVAYNWGETNLRNIAKWEDIPAESISYADTILRLLDNYEEDWR